jgi:hypothetical protein
MSGARLRRIGRKAFAVAWYAGRFLPPLAGLLICGGIAVGFYGKVVQPDAALMEDAAWFAGMGSGVPDVVWVRAAFLTAALFATIGANACRRTIEALADKGFGGRA